jgi:type I restriction enzyme M protein
MLGAIIGDIVGSRWEFNSIKSKDFPFLSEHNFITDDSMMTLAIAKSFLECNKDYSDLSQLVVKNMQYIGRKYPNGGYGGRFNQWLYEVNPQPYNSFGNGSAMRVSPCGIVAKSIDEAKMLSQKVTEVTHNHPEGLKGAEATAVAIFLARNGKSQREIKDYINDNYYPMNFTIDGIRAKYSFNEICQDTVPQAIMSFVEAKDFEDCLRNAVSLGGDADTLAAIAGSIAEYHFGISEDLRNQALKYLPKELLQILNAFENRYEKKEEDLKL